MTQPLSPARAAQRKEEALEQQGEEQLRCIYCGNTDPLVVRPRRIEDHHIVGGKRDPLTVPACLNCHAVATEGLRDAEVSMTCERDNKKFAQTDFWPPARTGETTERPWFACSMGSRKVGRVAITPRSQYPIMQLTCGEEQSLSGKNQYSQISCTCARVPKRVVPFSRPYPHTRQSACANAQFVR